jgi:hypothetical protein
VTPIIVYFGERNKLSLSPMIGRQNANQGKGSCVMMNVNTVSARNGASISEDALATISGGSFWGDVAAVGLGIAIAGVTVAGCVAAPETGGASAAGAADLDASMVAQLTAALNA